jgi:hypothetical protein
MNENTVNVLTSVLDMVHHVVLWYATHTHAHIAALLLYHLLLVVFPSIFISSHCCFLRSLPAAGGNMVYVHMEIHSSSSLRTRVRAPSRPPHAVDSDGCCCDGGILFSRVTSLGI